MRALTISVPEHPELAGIKTDAKLSWTTYSRLIECKHQKEWETLRKCIELGAKQMPATDKDEFAQLLKEME